MLQIEPPDFCYCPFCGRKLGIRVEEEKQRKYCRSCSWTYYPHVAGSVAAIITRGNKILLVQRNREPYLGKWMFPAGFIDYGEHPDEALQREVKEETGLAVREFQLLKVMQSVDDPRSLGHLLFFYRVTCKNGLLRTDRDENQNIGWFDIQSPPEIGWLSHQQTIKELQQL